MMRKIKLVLGVFFGFAVFGNSGCLSYSHYKYSQRAEAARVVPEGAKARPGRIYFASFPENCLAISILGTDHSFFKY